MMEYLPVLSYIINAILAALSIYFGVKYGNFKGRFEKVVILIDYVRDSLEDDNISDTELQRIIDLAKDIIA